MSPETPRDRVDLSRARAHWLRRDTIAWEPGALPRSARFRLHHERDALPVLAGRGLARGESFTLSEDRAGLDASLRERFPHLAGLKVFRVPPGALPQVGRLLKDGLAVAAADRAGRVLAATRLQIAGALDDMYREDGALGAVLTRGIPSLKIWAPTARSVRLHLFDGPRTPGSQVHAMAPDARTGSWSLGGTPEWIGKYYLYEVEVFVPATSRVERNLVTDPYSLSLARNSERSQIVELDSADLKPPGWDDLAKPRLEAPEDSVVYELHVRDFSASDPSVPAPLRGTFKAFTLPSSLGLDHLQSLADAGLTHVQLLPAFDFARVDEDRTSWPEPDEDLTALPPDSDRQQAAVRRHAERDGYNWGYDPWHYTVPEGSYATDADGGARILEFREMVQALNRRGLRVVLDVVYNHTSASGQAPRSVLDRIVPGYYHRLDEDGRVLRTTCCENTASEHAMMEKLIVDSLRIWARAYKIDGFRFDLMGHHMKRNLLRVREALDGLTPSSDGVDGASILLYGEGWDFGEMVGGARGENATQSLMAGSGIGSFNDRLRDAARGGGAFGPLQAQGVLTGLVDAPSGADSASADERHAQLLLLMDQIRVGVAGSLASYTFEDRRGRAVSGAEVEYAGGPAGYTRDPQESVNYVEAHDNETLFDTIQLKLPRWLPMGERVRAQNLGLSLVALGQGVPFVHAGMEMLRSKSLDRNSYDSGDWFNRLDFSCRSNNWGVGLPPAGENVPNWAVFRPLLADPALRPSEADIRRCVAHFKELLHIRRSSRLFRLRSAQEVSRHLRFHNTGPHQLPGLLAWSLRDPEGRIDPAHPLIVVLWNAASTPASLGTSGFGAARLRLHPILAASDDPIVRAADADAAGSWLRVPGRTAVVFWTVRGE